MSYKSKDRQTGILFEELLPFGGQLDEENRWIKLSEKIPWEKLEEIYRVNFSNRGRPGKDSRLINGLLIAKHETGMSDYEVVEYFFENIYLQYFCGYDHLVKKAKKGEKKEIEKSTLSRLRSKLGVKYFREFEQQIIEVLKANKIIKGNELQVDATVFPANITFPTDTGLVERVREFVVKAIKEIKKIGGIPDKIRTKCRVARKTYLDFQKKRKRTKKQVKKAKKSMLQYANRNIKQLKEMLERIKDLPIDMLDKFYVDWIKDRLKVAEKIYEQQITMLKENTNSIKDRIVSFHLPHIRPIVRGKSGKNVEFGPKCSLGHVGRCLVLDKMSFDAYNEGVVLDEDLDKHKQRFGKNPKVLIADKIFGNKENRKMLEEKGIKASFVPLGRKCKLSKAKEKWVKQKQKKRNEIEGAIGNAKVNYGLDRIKYTITGGEEIYIRLSLSVMNLKTMMARI